MKKATSVEEYIENNAHFKEELTLLRDLLLQTELEETLKWSAPVYTINGKNVVGLGAFKNHFGIWFFNGVFLKDEQGLLINAQEDKTKALRQMRFENLTEIKKEAILSYVKEAIDNQKLGKTVKPAKKVTKDTLKIPTELSQFLNQDKNLLKSFEALTPFKQKEYAEYIATAKREATKTSRLEKIKPMIENGQGLNDKYRNC